MTRWSSGMKMPWFSKRLFRVSQCLFGKWEDVCWIEWFTHDFVTFLVTFTTITLISWTITFETCTRLEILFEQRVCHCVVFHANQEMKFGTWELPISFNGKLLVCVDAPRFESGPLRIPLPGPSPGWQLLSFWISQPVLVAFVAPNFGEVRIENRKKSRWSKIIFLKYWMFQRR